MATIINCATDWTYDYFVEDVKIYGIEDVTNGEDYHSCFVAWLKQSVKRFLDKWNKEHDGKLYDRYDGWIGDAFARRMCDYRAGAEFSDLYKDTYGQRPHLPTWFYVHALGLPMREDTARMFCADPVQDAIDAAREYRTYNF